MAPDSLLFCLDASGIVHGANLPPGQCRTVPAVVAEFAPGGATRRRLDQFLAAGLVVREPSAAARGRVEATARASGALGRLSRADRDVLALCLDEGAAARLVTDDYTIQDVARRLGVTVQPVAERGIRTAVSWGARCSGCGRRYEADRAGTECAVCGARVRAVPRTHR